LDLIDAHELWIALIMIRSDIDIFLSGDKGSGGLELIEDLRSGGGESLIGLIGEINVSILSHNLNWQK
jgi:hypothetical protein